MEQLHFITKLLDIKDPNIQILDIINKDTHKEIIAKLEATNNLIKLIKHNAFGFRNFENFKKERTKFVLSKSSLSSTHYS
ncbi:transposase [Streptococcus pneumoniae]|nr:transposase [Streptococcus pneumoniae]VJY95332.1 transposase [Streptococcus pneumoniae]